MTSPSDDDKPASALDRLASSLMSRRDQVRRLVERVLPRYEEFLKSAREPQPYTYNHTDRFPATEKEGRDQIQKRVLAEIERLGIIKNVKTLADEAVRRIYDDLRLGHEIKDRACRRKQREDAHRKGKDPWWQTLSGVGGKRRRGR